MKTNELRKLFLQYFEGLGHQIVASSPLIPANDPTLLFTNAGMVQFKDVFLGLENRSYTTAATVQKCLRAGGKHNDLENVGFTARHHTFFEMLGNFSFGAYFKREAIQYAWNFLTQELKLPPEKLWVTVHEKDKETEEIWLKEMKIDPRRFSRCGDKDNFWSMGDTGPCGYCSEIFYDHGPSIPGGPPGSPEEHLDRYVEIWNLVFMQFNRTVTGNLEPLPKPSVDTGMGLERLAAVMQGVHHTYDIDVFQDLISSATKLANIKDLHHQSLRVIADHIRACAFLIADGIIPSNEGRGYVLRRICRRAIRHGHHLGIASPFFYKLLPALVKSMGTAYPELIKQQSIIEKILKQEEEQFSRTLDTGLQILEENMQKASNKIITGEIAFRLYDTYGFPLDLTETIAREKNFTVDVDGFNEAMALQRSKAREASQFAMTFGEGPQIQVDHVSEFHGYEKLEEQSEIVGLYYQKQAVNSLQNEQTGIVVLNYTPFYAEAGGQIGDEGKIISLTGDAEFTVETTKKVNHAYLHYGKMSKGKFSIGEKVKAEVHSLKRKATMRNHSATHLLHAALRVVLGDHVQQKGSLVDPLRLRFDFSHFEATQEEQLRQIEKQVNQQILLNTPVHTDQMSIDAALESGAQALFGEKYGDQVRVLRMGENNYSIELCGGTHVSRTGDIGLFKIVSESGISAGIRRIEAVTGEEALQYIERMEKKLKQVSSMLKTNPDLIEEKIQQLTTKLKEQDKKFEKMQSAQFNLDAFLKQAEQAGYLQEKWGVKILTAEIPGLSDTKALRSIVDQIKDKLKTAIIILSIKVDAKRVMLVAGVTQNYTDKIKASDIMQWAAPFVEGKGGGRADFAEAGGTRPEGLQDIQTDIISWLEKKLGNKKVEA